MASNNDDNNWQCGMRSLSDCGAFLFENQKISDIKFTFKGENKEIYAHSWILAMMSPIFYQSFKNNFEVEKNIPVTDKNYAIYLEVMRFIYTSECDLTPENAFDIMAVASKYSIKFLEQDCVELLTTTFSIDSACKILDMSIVNNYEELKGKVIDYVGSELQTIMETESFLAVSHEGLQNILRLENIGPIAEVELFSRTMKWAEKKCIVNKMEVNGKNKRLQLRDLVKLIRFPTMSCDEFGRCVEQEDGFFTEQEEHTLFKSIATKRTNMDTGFVNVMRKHNIGWSEEIQEKRIQIENYCSIDWIPITKEQGITKFSVNKTIYLTQLWVANSKCKQNATIKIMDDKNTILKQVKCKPNFSYTTHKNCANLEYSTFIQQNKIYIIDITFDDYTDLFECWDHPTVPFEHAEHEVKFNFKEFSPLLGVIKFKPIH